MKARPSVLTRDILKGYFLELIVALFSVVIIFVDAGFFEDNKLYIVLPGIGLVFLSTVSKIRDGYKSRSTHELIDDLSNRVIKKDETLNEAHELIKRQQKESQEKSAELEEQNDLITRLIKEGLITEKNIFEIIQRNRFFYLFCYQNVPEQKFIEEKILKKAFRNPSLEAVEEIGFVKVGVRSNLYVIPVKMLPLKLRTEEKIERLLKKLVKEKWNIFLSELEDVNKEYFKEYKTKHGDPTNCTYMIVASNFHDVIIDFIGYNSFSRSFKNMLKYNVDIKKLKKEISKRKHDIKEFIKSISYELLLSDISAKKDRELIQEKGENITKKLKIDDIFEFKDKKDELKGELSNLFTEAKAKKYSNIISGKSKKYNELFYLLGIEI